MEAEKSSKILSINYWEGEGNYHRNVGRGKTNKNKCIQTKTNRDRKSTDALAKTSEYLALQKVNEHNCSILGLVYYK